MSCSDVAEYLMQCVCSDQLNIQLKAVLTIKHLSAEVITFQQYFRSCQGALRILSDIAAPPIVPQARSLEPIEVRTVRDATQSAIDAINTPHTVEKQTESAYLKERCIGFGNYEPPPEEIPERSRATGQVAEFVGDSIGDMVSDFKEKGAVGAVKDATIDALDLVLDGVDAVWGWVAGKGHEAPRICQPQNPFLGGQMGPGLGLGFQQSPGAFQPPPIQHPISASNHYAAAFGGFAVGANNPVMYSSSLTGAHAAPIARAATDSPHAALGCAEVKAPQSAPAVEAQPARVEDSAPEVLAPEPEPAATVDLLSLGEPHKAAELAPVADLLGEDKASATLVGPHPSREDMLVF